MSSMPKADWSCCRLKPWDQRYRELPEAFSHREVSTDAYPGVDEVKPARDRPPMDEE